MTDLRVSEVQEISKTEIPYGYCRCGCGTKTAIPTRNRHGRGVLAGVPLKYVHGHNARKPINKNVYRYTYVPSMKIQHPEHCFIAITALGKPLPTGAEVHHVNGMRGDNRNDNLVVCQNKEYHKLLHRRTRALKDTGHANYLKCTYCKQYDRPENVHITNGEKHIWHRECRRKYCREWMENRS